MYRIDFCPACGSQNIKKELAQLAHFIVWMATDEFFHDNINTYSVVCNECSFIGSGLRLTTDETDKFYRNYRGEDYTNKRIFCEPWYKDYIETFDKKKYAEDRKTRINYFIDKHIDRVYINTVLDYWGGSGEHIPVQFVKAKRFVANITPTTTLPDIINFNFSTQHSPIDFIMCCGILEHQSDPDILMNIVRQCMNQNSWLYLEVPFYEYPKYDLFHEHVNIWNLTSLTAFLNRFQIEIVDHTFGDAISILARIK
jgi:hypothetical protein